MTRIQVKKNERRKNNLIREKISLVGEKIAKKVTYSSLRSSPNITILAEQASNYLLDREHYPFVNWDREDVPKVQLKFGTKNLFDTEANKEADLSEMEPLIVFTIGGLAHNEISSLEKLQNNNTVNHRIYIGSTNVMNAKEYMKKLGEINQDFGKEIGNDCLEDNNDDEDDKLIKDNDKDKDNKKKSSGDKDKIE